MAISLIECILDGKLFQDKRMNLNLKIFLNFLKKYRWYGMPLQEKSSNPKGNIYNNYSVSLTLTKTKQSPFKSNFILIKLSYSF